MRYMEDGAVLNAGARTDPNHLYIAAHRRMRPNADVITQPDITHDDSRRVDHHALAQHGCDAQPFADIGLTCKIHGAQSASPAVVARVPATLRVGACGVCQGYHNHALIILDTIGLY